jgi:hypothetical protein
MSTAEVLAEIKALPETERVKVAQETLRQLGADDLKTVERTLRRLAHPEVPDSFWDAAEDMESNRGVDMETALHEDPPADGLQRSKD